MLALCFVIACHEEPLAPPPNRPASLSSVGAAVTDNVVASVALLPDSQMVFTGDRFKITARPKNAAGQALDRSVRWAVSPASVAKALDSLKPVMPFKALRVGTASIKATADGKSRTARIILRAVAGAKVVVTPDVATVASGATVKFVATGMTEAGETAMAEVTWKAAGGTISGAGVLTAGNTPGTYQVIATARFGAADTSVVTIAAAESPAATVVLVPATASVTAGGTIQFFAYGRTAAGDSVPATATYTATGGAIGGAGLYTAAQTAGTYRVIAKTDAGAADTAAVVISAGAAVRVTLLPDIAASRAGATTSFVASAWNALGESLPNQITYVSTCGTITGAGVFTAPQGGPGACLVVASAEGKADTTEVVLLPNLPDQGAPFGVFGLWTSGSATPTSGVAAFTASHDHVAASDIIGQIGAARAKGIRLVLAMTGGAHNRYKTSGVFDLAKWTGAMDAYNKPAIQAAVAAGVADGTIIGNSVMDEPHQAGQSDDEGKTWGPPGTMTKARVDGMCAYVKGIFPTLPTGVGHDHSVFEPANSYRVCDFLMAQYVARKGNIVAWRNAGLALAARDGMAVIFSMNLLNGAPQDKTGAWDCPGTGGLGSFAPNCRMAPAQVRDYAEVLGQAGCALLGWRYDAAFMAKPENQAVISDVANRLSRLPRKACGRTGTTINIPPVPVFASTCGGLTCDFTDGSTDSDGGVVAWSWNFGDGDISTARHPSHTYSGEGEYQVSLMVTDDDNATGSVTRTVTVAVPNTPPGAAFTPTCVELTCSFTDESTDDGEVTWSWNFGDGETSTVRHPTHTYGAGGEYEVTLTVTDDADATGSITHTVTVTAPPPPNTPPVAVFTPACVELTCSFTDASTDDDGAVTAWSWDFGDGSNSTERHPNHTYDMEGSYQVILVVTDDREVTGTVTQTVSATVPPEPPAGP